MYHANLLGGIISRVCGVRNIYWSIHHYKLEPDKSKKGTVLAFYLGAILSRIIPVKINNITDSNYIIVTHNTEYKIYDIMYVYSIEKIKDRIIEINTIDSNFNKFVFTSNNNNEYTFYLTQPSKNSKIQYLYKWSHVILFTKTG